MSALALLAAAVLLASPADEPVRPGGAVPTPARVQHVPPQYPAALRGAMPRPMGVVVLEVQLHEDGRPADIRVARGEPALNESAIAAVKQWRYAPTVVDGRPRKVVLFEMVDVFPDAESKPAYFARLLKDEKETQTMRLFAVLRLAALGPGNKTALDALRRAADDKDPVVGKAATDALGRLGAPAR